MLIKNEAIDGGKSFDWGKISFDYAKYRDIYPKEFYNKIIARGLCINGQSVLDLGTGQAYCREIYTNTVQNGRQRIFLKIRLNRQRAFQKE